MDRPTAREQGGGMELADLYRRSVEAWTARVGAVPDDKWDAPTPCTDWTVRDLVNHVVGEDAWTAPLMRGSTIADVGDSLDGDLLGEQPIQAARRNADEALAAVSDTLPSGGKVHLSYGEEDMGEYIHQLIADHLMHAWDLAAATGEDTAFDTDLVQEVGAWFAEREEMYRQAGVIGPRIEAGGDSQSELIGRAGRDPAWTPPQP
jgi:uncharacterized protein (TIGR03086 family)